MLPAEITTRCDIKVELVQSGGNDNAIAAAARVITAGQYTEMGLHTFKPADLAVALDSIKPKHQIIDTMMKYRHGTPFEHNSMTFYVECPIFVAREWFRHRIGWCLAGDTEIYLETISPNFGRTLRKRPIAELWRNWHHGVTDVTGRTRLLAACRNLPCRVLNERTGLFELGRMTDIVQSGIKPLIKITTSRGHVLKCSTDHRIYTADGWMLAGEVQVGQRLGVNGRVPIPGDKVCPPALRRGIGVWTSMQRKRIIKDVDTCRNCGATFLAEQLVLDHAVPVVLDLSRALDIGNLQPYCEVCHRLKTNAEQVHATGRGGVAGVIYDPVISVENIPEEMTYDISMEAPHHNFMANGIVVHNSYNEWSGRYKHLQPVFWVPAAMRAVVEPDGFKPMRPELTHDAGQRDQTCMVMKEAYNLAWIAYRTMIDNGIAREVARAVLPVGIYTSFWATCNMRSLMAFLSLRTKDERSKIPSFPMAEIDDAARQMEAHAATLFPHTVKAFNDNGRFEP